MDWQDKTACLWQLIAGEGIYTYQQLSYLLFSSSLCVYLYINTTTLSQ